MLKRTLASSGNAPGCAVLVWYFLLNDLQTDWHEWQQHRGKVLWRAKTRRPPQMMSNVLFFLITKKKSVGVYAAPCLFAATAGLRIVNSSLCPGYWAYYCTITKHTLTHSQRGRRLCVGLILSENLIHLYYFKEAPSLPLIITMSNQHHPLQILSELSVTDARKCRPCWAWNVSLQQLNNQSTNYSGETETPATEAKVLLL